MLLKDFEETLKNISNDNMIMLYGDNMIVINNLLSITNIVDTLMTLVRNDRSNSMLRMNLSQKLGEIESILVNQGAHMLAERGINISHGFFNPMQSQQQMYYNQNMFPPQQMYNNSMYQQPMFNQQQPDLKNPPPITPQMPSSPPQYQQPQSQPVFTNKVENPSTPEVALPPKPTAQKSSGSSNAGVNNFALPGLNGGSDNAKAAGRDYLLKLLEDRE